MRVPTAGGAGTQVAQLPALSSDQSAAAMGGTAYVVGGYTGSRWVDTIVGWRPGSPARVVAHPAVPSALCEPESPRPKPRNPARLKFGRGLPPSSTIGRMCANSRMTTRRDTVFRVSEPGLEQ